MWLKLLAASAGLLSPWHALAQNIDTSQVRLTLGQPVALTLYVRSDESPGKPLAPNCVRAQLQFGDTELGPEQFRVRTQADGNGTRVTLSHPAELTEPIAQARIELVCGPAFAREFTILAEPPPTGITATAAQKIKVSAHPAARHTPKRNDLASKVRSPATTEWLATDKHAAVDTPLIDSGLGLSLPQLKALAAAITALRQEPPLTEAPQPLGSPTRQPLQQPQETTPDPGRHAMQEELDRLRHEQGQTAMMMNALLVRLEQQDHSRSMQTTWLISAMLLTLVAIWLTPITWQTWLRRQRPRARPAPAQIVPTPWVDALPSQPAPPQPVDTERPASSAPTATANLSATGLPMPPLPTDAADLRVDAWPSVQDIRRSRRQSWPDADFGRPTLEYTPPALLHEIDTLLAQGYPGACAVALEQALQDGTGKHPALLLRLLDVYQALNQPGNHERVCAQLEALYNIRVAAMEEAQAEGPGLEGFPALLTSISQQWRQASCADSLRQLLLRSGSAPAFELAAFKDLLLLHSIATEPEPGADIASISDFDADWNNLPVSLSVL
ncbi:MAG: hypothetical protein AB3X44_13985 [Leptothrix sp. (in: b-proteobacteria)]